MTITDDKGQQIHCWQGDGDQRCGLREFEIKDFWTLLAAHVMLVFLAINGIELSYTQEELIDVILQVASGKIHAQGLLEWILQHQA